MPPRKKKNLTEEEKKIRRREQKKMTMRRLRQKENQNPNALEERRRKDRERYHKKKANNKIKTINDYTPREQRILRKKWREKARKYRNLRKMQKKAQEIINTPPSSPGPSSTSRTISGRNVASRNRRRLITENLYLKSRVQILEAKAAKYRMRAARYRKKVKESQRQTKDIINESKKKKQAKDIKRKKEVRLFLEEDECSRLTAGKKETITKNKEKKQIRLLNDTMQNLHKKFLNKTKTKISYSLFCKYRPFWIIMPKEKHRNTCLCSIHTNVGNLVKTLRNSKIISSTSPLSLAKTICCNDNNILKELCLERKCNICKEKELQFNEYNEEERVLYEKWGTKRVKVTVKGKEKTVQKTVKESLLLTKKEAVEMIKKQIIIFMQHQANINHQFKKISYIKESMCTEEALLHIDFSENYLCKYGEEIQSAHFGGSKPQICLHTSVLYYKDKETGSLKTESFCTLTQNLRHDPILVCAHLKPVFERIRQLIPNLETLHILSDGAVNQYRNKKMFHLIVNYICPFFDLKKFMWHFTEAGHGKGAPDGVGGSVKRTADRGAVLGNDVNDFEKLVSYLKSNCKRINIIPIDDSCIPNIEEKLKVSIQPFKGTLSIHQVVWSHLNPFTLRARRLSCIKCDPEKKCKNYEIGIIETENMLASFSEPENSINKPQPPIQRKRKTFVLYSSDSNSESEDLTQTLNNVYSSMEHKSIYDKIYSSEESDCHENPTYPKSPTLNQLNDLDSNEPKETVQICSGGGSLDRAASKFLQHIVHIILDNFTKN